MQAYSDPRRESDPHALTDVEVLYLDENDIEECAACNKNGNGAEHTEHVGYYWQSCFPGCLPESDPSGPFSTEAEALADCRETSGLCEHGIPDDERCEDCVPSPLWVVQSSDGAMLYESMRHGVRCEMSCAAWSTQETAERAAAKYPGMTARRLTDDEAREWSHGKAPQADAQGEEE